MEAIRAKCLDCMAGSPYEVRQCVAVACPSWPYRMGKNPFRAPQTETQRAAALQTLAKMHADAADARSGRGKTE